MTKIGGARLTNSCLILVVLTLMNITLPMCTQTLQVGFYNHTCCEAEAVIKGVVKNKFDVDKTIVPGLLRMYFHDCFVQGCDASLLLNSNSGNEERDSFPNQTIHGVDVIDLAKLKLENICPGVVSCADIIALATRDAVALAGGKPYEVPCGRWDGLISSKEAADVGLPGPQSSVMSAASLFSAKGLNKSDMVTLLGAHTVGVAHCVFFRDRLYNNGRTGGGPDPNMNKTLLVRLSKICPNDTAPLGPTADMDGDTPKIIDNVYYKELQLNSGVLQLDQSLTHDAASKAVVNTLAQDSSYFNDQFVQALIKLGNIPGTPTTLIRNVRTLCKNR